MSTYGLQPPVPAVPAPPRFGAAAQGAFFNYMGMGQLPKGALQQLQDTQSYMAGMMQPGAMSSPAGSAPLWGQPAGREPTDYGTSSSRAYGGPPEPAPLYPRGQPAARAVEEQPPRPLSLPEITSPNRGSGVHLEEPSAEPSAAVADYMSGRVSAAADYEAPSRAMLDDSDDSDDMGMQPVSRRVVSRQSILSRGSRGYSLDRGTRIPSPDRETRIREEPREELRAASRERSRGGSRGGSRGRSRGSQGLNDTGSEFWSNENSRKKHRRITCTVDQAIEMIRSKITERMDGRAGWLRRAFVDFDTDGSGSISFDEFIAAVEFKTALVFDATVLQGVMDRFVTTKGEEINFNKFVQLVMGSTSRENTVQNLLILY